MLLNGLLVHSKHIGISDRIYVERLVGRLEFWRPIDNTTGLFEKLELLRDYEIELIVQFRRDIGSNRQFNRAIAVLPKNRRRGIVDSWPAFRFSHLALSKLEIEGCI